MRWLRAPQRFLYSTIHIVKQPQLLYNAGEMAGWCSQVDKHHFSIEVIPSPAGYLIDFDLRKHAEEKRWLTKGITKDG
jgi:hypothetical protein